MAAESKRQRRRRAYLESRKGWVAASNPDRIPGYTIPEESPAECSVCHEIQIVYNSPAVQTRNGVTEYLYPVCEPCSKGQDN